MSDSSGQTKMDEKIQLQKLKLFNIIQKHWCPSFPYDEDCKHCYLEIDICEELWKPCGVPCYDEPATSYDSSSTTKIEKEE